MGKATLQNQGLLEPSPDLDVIREGRSVDLVAITPAWYPRLYDELSRDVVAATWRTRGRSLPPGDFERVFMDQVDFTVAMVTRSSPRDVIGVLQLMSLDAEAQHAGLAVAAFQNHLGSGRAIEGVLLFLDECFARFPLRKVYARMSESSMEAVGSFLRFFTCEGVLREHLVMQGRLQDVTISSITGADFAELVRHEPLVRRCSRDPWKVDRSAVATGVGPATTDAAGPGDVDDLLRRITDLEASELGEDQPLELDSLGTIELIVGIEELLGREVADEAVTSLATVADVRNLVAALTRS